MSITERLSSPKFVVVGWLVLGVAWGGMYFVDAIRGGHAGYYVAGVGLVLFGAANAHLATVMAAAKVAAARGHRLLVARILSCVALGIFVAGILLRWA